MEFKKKLNFLIDNELVTIVTTPPSLILGCLTTLCKKLFWRNGIQSVTTNIDFLRNFCDKLFLRKGIQTATTNIDFLRDLCDKLFWRKVNLGLDVRFGLNTTISSILGDISVFTPNLCPV
ncbi:hypothetical protein A3Q56_01322 [Intoshia linei]|uniref:Uncharacterized protein n=1 Tax=Intoshia linei TaxID=1819745 RepID=A0A177B9Q4_9BILA|nr:hypothetical protein A3Q56_01322 [Intoshia linei]